MIHYGTLGDQTIYTRFGVNLFVYFTYHFRTPVFQYGASLVIYSKSCVLLQVLDKGIQEYRYICIHTWCNIVQFYRKMDGCGSSKGLLDQ